MTMSRRVAVIAAVVAAAGLGLAGSAPPAQAVTVNTIAFNGRGGVSCVSQSSCDITASSTFCTWGTHHGCSAHLFGIITMVANTGSGSLCTGFGFGNVRVFDMNGRQMADDMVVAIVVAGGVAAWAGLTEAIGISGFGASTGTMAFSCGIAVGNMSGTAVWGSVIP